MNILVAGASGFIGRNLVEYLKTKHQVNPISLREKNWEQQIHSPSVFINLIGKAHDHKKIATKSDYDYVNLELTKFLFQRFQDSEATLFIHISSLAAVEEIGSSTIIDTNTTPNPISFYGKSKKAADDYLLKQSLATGKRLIILRPTMVHGPGDKGNLNLLINFVLKGIPYPLGAFDNKRSFLSIDNLCFIISEILTKEIPNGVYYVSDDKPLSTTTIIKTIALVSKKKIRIFAFPKTLMIGLAKLGDFLRLPLNSSRLEKLTSNLIVSNKEIKDSLNLENLPFTAKEGLVKTIGSFLSTKSP